MGCIETMQSAKGNDVPNQLTMVGHVVVKHEGETLIDGHGSIFVSYGTLIAVKEHSTGKVVLDEYYWDYSVTTGKYRNQFLKENKGDTLRKIESGEYTEIDLADVKITLTL